MISSILSIFKLFIKLLKMSKPSSKVANFSLSNLISGREVAPSVFVSVGFDPNGNQDYQLTADELVIHNTLKNLHEDFSEKIDGVLVNQQIDFKKLGEVRKKLKEDYSLDLQIPKGLLQTVMYKIIEGEGIYQDKTIKDKELAVEVLKSAGTLVPIVPNANSEEKKQEAFSKALDLLRASDGISKDMFGIITQGLNFDKNDYCGEKKEEVEKFAESFFDKLGLTIRIAQRRQADRAIESAGGFII